MCRTQIPHWLRWLQWLSPLYYTLTGLANNELLGPSYEGQGALQPPSLAPDGIGRLVLGEFDIRIGNKWRCETAYMILL